MGNCQQCTNECPSTSEIQTKLTKRQQMTDQTQQLSKKQLASIIKIQAAFKGYMARKQGVFPICNRKYSFRSNRSTQPKISSLIQHQNLLPLEKQLSDLINQNPPQQIQDLNQNSESKQFEEKSTQQFCKADMQFKLNKKGSLDNISQMSEMSRQQSKARQFTIEMNCFCFEPENVSVPNTDIQQKHPMIKMKNGATYEGQWKNGRANGFGKYDLPDGSSYIGDWKDNKACGFGTFLHFDGDFFKGSWAENQVQGNGKYTFKDGSVYEGEWKDDQPNGTGTQTYDGGWIYEGSFLNGNKHGQGKLTFPDGSQYTGSFSNDLISGFGTLNCSDGRMYVGEWKNGNKHGKGVFTWADGRKYDGYYVHDERDGYGVLQWPSGQKYLGLWKQGLQHGNGQIIKKNGQSFRGRWIKGKKIQQQITISSPQQ